MKVLIVGSGGREHAMAWKLSRSASVTEVFAAPGNPGIAQIGRCFPGAGTSPAELLHLARELAVDLTVVGPEAPLVAGIVDIFRNAGLRIVGPSQANARLEGSKVWAKQFFREHSIPTAAFLAVHTPEEARKALDQMSRYPVVVKADGLAAGKGVIIADDRAQAETAIEQLGPDLVIEEFLTGEEVSFLVLTDGRDVLPLAPAQDHKRIFDGDRGPNTGGMGAYSDSYILSARDTERILDMIVRPTIAATGFTGFLYAGLMMTADGPKLLEYNVRLGDPETQPILHRMVADFGQVLLAAAEGRLREAEVKWRPEPAVCVVLASAGYPESSQSGVPIRGIDLAEAQGVTVFQAGTRMGAQGLETAGGRVLGVTASGLALPDAIRNAYAAVSRIHFNGMQFRTDIGQKGLRHYNERALG